MLLRRSGEKSNQSFHLEGITAIDAQGVGIKNEQILLEIADAVYAGDPVELKAVRLKGTQLLSAEAMVDAIGVAAGFNGITKIANATGIPLDESTESQTVDMRRTTQIDDYTEARKSQLWDQHKKPDQP
ncbi:MAG: hypothetical protein ACJAR0_002141 [Candidatus Azotimanducaceae bacterium]|jgi:hypothetical protein